MATLNAIYSEEQLGVAERVYVTLKERVVQGHYQPHQRIVETDIGDELGASRTPVRQALQRLELEGLIDSARHGWTVRGHSREDIERVYDVRIALESYASRLATERASDEELSHIESVHNEIKARGPGQDRARFIQDHDEFHDALYRAANNQVLRDAIARYREHPFNKRVAEFYSDEELEDAIGGHERIVSALKERNPDELEQITREHVRLAESATLKRLTILVS